MDKNQVGKHGKASIFSTFSQMSATTKWKKEKPTFEKPDFCNMDTGFVTKLKVAEAAQRVIKGYHNRRSRQKYHDLTE